MTKSYHYLFTVILLLLCTCSFANTEMIFRITGLNDKATDNAINHLKIQLKTAGKLTPAKIQALYQSGPDDIQDAIKPFGYFRAQITHKTLKQEGNKWTAHYHINSGQRLLITSLSIHVAGPGTHDLKIDKALTHPHIKIGQPLNIPKYTKTKNSLLNTAEDHGYIKASFSEDKILIDLKAYTCAITITLNTGPRYYFGPTTFNKNPLNDKFLHRYLSYKVDEPFSSQKLLDLQTNLGDAGYYESVGVEPQIEQAQNYHIPVKVTVTPLKRRRYQFGVGYGTVTGPRVTAGILWRWINSSGDKINTNINWSKVNRY